MSDSPFCLVKEFGLKLSINFRIIRDSDSRNWEMNAMENDHHCSFSAMCRNGVFVGSEQCETILRFTKATAEKRWMDFQSIFNPVSA